jgi:hypothetical protein
MDILSFFLNGAGGDVERAVNHFYASEGKMPTSPRCALVSSFIPQPTRDAVGCVAFVCSHGAAASPSATSEDQPLSADDYAALLIDLYQRCNPEKVSEVPALLEQFRGRERELFEAVQSKYGMGASAGTSAYTPQQLDERRSTAAHPAAPYLAEMRQYVGDDPRNDVSAINMPL